MNEIPRQKLVEIIKTHGSVIIDDQRRCANLLRDYLGGYKREVNLFILALEQEVPQDLFSQVKTSVGKPENQQSTNNTLPKNLLLTQFAQRLVDNLSITAEAAQWAVESWALALNFISLSELSGISDKNSLTPAKKELDIQPSIASDGRPTLTVSKLGMGQYKSIGEALKAASAGMRILIKPGLYKETLILDKPIEIVGDGLLEDIVIEAEPCILPSSDQISIHNVRLLGSFSLATGKMGLVGCKVGEINISGDFTQLTARKCKINHINLDQGRLYIEECEIFSANLSGSSNITFIKSLIARFTNNIERTNDRSQPQNDPVDFSKFITIFDQCKFGSIDITEGKPYFTNCIIASTLPDPESPLVKISSAGSGIFENCDFSGHAQTPIIYILGSRTPAFRSCKVHNSSESGTVGIYFGKDSEGWVDGCEIYNNEIGIEIVLGGNPIIRTSKITRNSKYGIAVHDKGAGIVEDCDLRNNTYGAFSILPGCFTRQNNNKE